jgi:glutamate-1-semialdehyde 2,1-aminomutase
MRRYTRSQEYLTRAERTIPLGSQTISKSRALYPYGVSPFFVTHAQGSRVWDVDGNEYIDFVNGLATINLGHGDPDVTRAVEQQLKHGVVFSLSHPLEAQVAEAIVAMVPCAESVRFGKNGSDVTAGAIRLARAYTSRDHVAVCGYHGWQDWYIGATPRNKGVPQATRALTHTFPYNDVEALQSLFREYPRQIAAVILEPMNRTEPHPGYLARLKDLVHDAGALLIFDEMVTGFRFAKGGAQEYFGVIPDLATLGKGLANGYPLSALVGRADVMKLLDEVFFSLTYGGEALSLAAAQATLIKINTQPVLETMTRSGQRLQSGIEQRIARHGCDHIIGISGHPTWTFIGFRDVGGYTERQVQVLFMQEMLDRGFLTFGLQFVSYAHTEQEIDLLLAAYDEILPLLMDAVDNRQMDRHLRCKVEPAFKLR